MMNKQKTKTKWGEGWLPAAALALVLAICLLTAMNRLPRKVTVEPVHFVENDLYDAALIDINAADAQTLMRLPDIGATLAERIIAARPYQSVDDLLKVDGIGSTTLEQLRPLIKCGQSVSGGLPCVI